MAKTKMMCPFSGKLCAECAIYRGRHYYMCFNVKYRGYLNETRQSQLKKPSYVWGSTKKIEVPVVKTAKAIDPFAIILKERAEMGTLKEGFEELSEMENITEGAER